MNPFTYTRADNAATAVHEIAAGGQAKFIAGGTNLIDLMKMNVEKPNRLIDLNHLDLQTIQPTPDGGLRIGALVSNPNVAYDEQVEPPLSAPLPGDPRGSLERSFGTWRRPGGTCCCTRCAYFYDTATPCNKREPGSGCPAVQGLNRMHAILGTSEHCIAVHPSDMCVALAALEAVVRVTGPGGDRQIPIAEFHRLPADTPQFDSTLQANELITAVDLPRTALPTTRGISSFGIGNRSHSRWCRWRPPWSWTVTRSKRRACTRWGGSTNRGAILRPRLCSRGRHPPATISAGCRSDPS